MKNGRQELRSIYLEIKERVGERLHEFSRLKTGGSDDEIFEELVFCILTPQSKARQAEKALAILKKERLLYKGDALQLSERLNIVRFKNHKAQYICNAREMFYGKGKPLIKTKLVSFSGSIELRDWLSENIMGLGYKEASHFVRNTGYFTDAAILDRHIIRNLCSFGVLEKMEKNLTRKNYLEIESKMNEFSREIGIPMDYLDFVLMYRDTGDIFK